MSGLERPRYRILQSVLAVFGFCLLMLSAPSQTQELSPFDTSHERFLGFAVPPPSDDRWRLIRDEQKRFVATFVIEPLSPTHTLSAKVHLRELPRSFESKDAFRDYFVARLREREPRLEEVSFDAELTEAHGQWALRYRIRYRDTQSVNSATPLQVSIVGIAFRHPLMKGALVDAFYTERGTESELDGSLDALGEALITSAIPTVPYPL